MADNPVNVVVYSAPWCGFCRMAKAYLASKDVPFKEVDVDQDQMAAMYIFHKTGQAGIPIIEFDDQVVIGFDRPKIDLLLRDNKLV